MYEMSECVVCVKSDLSAVLSSPWAGLIRIVSLLYQYCCLYRKLWYIWNQYEFLFGRMLIKNPFQKKLLLFVFLL